MSFVQRIIVDLIISNLRCFTLLCHCNGIIFHTEVYDETFDVNCKIAQTMQNI